MNVYFCDIPAFCVLLFALPILFFVFRILAQVFMEETAELSRHWQIRRSGFWDAGQSQAVRHCAERLGAKRRRHRIEAVRILAELADPTAVPALICAAERYHRDVPFLLCVVQTLQRLDDPRALPALRRLTANHHYGLMQAARWAISELEPRHVLLRAAVPAASESLLRPAKAPNSPSDTQSLLRSSSDTSPYRN